MEENEILREIHRTREAHARECNYDVPVMFERMRAETERLKASGWKVVSFARTPADESTAVVREDPPKP